MFAITNHKGFSLTFANGVRLSVQFGAGNYCENQCDGWDRAAQSDYYRSEHAEIAIISPHGSWLTQDLLGDLGDDVKGWVSTNELADIIAKCVVYIPEKLEKAVRP